MKLIYDEFDSAKAFIILSYSTSESSELVAFNIEGVNNFDTEIEAAIEELQPHDAPEHYGPANPHIKHSPCTIPYTYVGGTYATGLTVRVADSRVPMVFCASIQAYIPAKVKSHVQSDELHGTPTPVQFKDAFKIEKVDVAESVPVFKMVPHNPWIEWDVNFIYPTEESLHEFSALISYMNEDVRVFTFVDVVTSDSVLVSSMIGLEPMGDNGLLVHSLFELLMMEPLTEPSTFKVTAVYEPRMGVITHTDILEIVVRNCKYSVTNIDKFKGDWKLDITSLDESLNRLLEGGIII